MYYNVLYGRVCEEYTVFFAAWRRREKKKKNEKKSSRVAAHITFALAA